MEKTVLASDGHNYKVTVTCKEDAGIPEGAELAVEEITMGLGTGTYYLREKAAPSGFKKLAEDLCFTIGQDGTVRIHNAGYANWLTKDTSVPGTVSYQISIENTPLGITVRKKDDANYLLSGSKFKLSKKNAAGSFEVVTGYGVGENGLIDLTGSPQMTLTGMPDGIYQLKETQAPSGYIVNTRDTCFKVSNGTVILTDEDGTEKNYTDAGLEDNDTTIVVINHSGAALPSTGGPGTSLFMILGSVLIAGAGLLLLRKRKTI